MSYTPIERKGPASSKMLVVSLFLHAAVIGSVVLYFALSPQDQVKKTPPSPVIMPVVITDGPVAKPKPKPIEDAGPVSLPQPEIDVSQRVPEKEPPEKSVKSMEASSVLKAETKKLKLKKRRRRPKVAKAPEPKKLAKKKEPPKEEKRDPSEIIEKRLATIREKLKERRSADGPSSIKAPNAPDQTADRGSGPGATEVDENLLRWFGLVRERINANWSVLGESRRGAKVTVIGANVAEDGSLVSVSISRSSGDLMFDQSAMRALLRSAPFPPMAAGMKEKIQVSGGLAFRFTPGGLQ